MSNSALIDGAKPFADFRIRRPSFFLSLVPVQSASYPTQPKISSPTPSEAPIEAQTASSKIEPPTEAGPVEVEAPVPHARADSTSSVASEASEASNKRFLKLGPVFWGGNGEADDYAVEG